MTASILAATPIHGLPVWLANLWRVLVFATMALLIGDYLRTLPGAIWYRRAPSWALFGRAALLCFVLRAAVQMGERWNLGATWEGVPATTVCVGLAVASRVVYRRAKARGDFAAGIEP